MARMQLVDLGESGRVNMGVDLGGADVGMSEQFLDGANVGSALKHV